MTAIVDTNILLSGLLGIEGSSSRRILSLIKEGTLKIVTSPLLLKEFHDVINRPKFHRLIDDKEKLLVFRFIQRHAIVVVPQKTTNICRDPKDNKVLDCAMAGRALTNPPRIIITGDKDLLTLSPFKGMEIVPPSLFLKIYRYT